LRCFLFAILVFQQEKDLADIVFDVAERLMIVVTSWCEISGSIEGIVATPRALRKWLFRARQR
jgi:hypothetical protein